MPAVSSPNVSSAATLPRSEHPRPIFKREPWISLNGRWRFGFDPRDIGEQSRWYRLRHPRAGGSERGQGTLAAGLNFEPGRGVRTGDPFGDEIVVPFPWESRLSGIGNTDYKGAAWYQRVLEVPREWGADSGEHEARGARPEDPGSEPTGLPSMGDAATGGSAGVGWRLRPFLCFGAVDWSARVWVNGRFAAEHAGGYTPFSVDLSNLVRPGEAATLTVRVWDTSAAEQPLGKQVERWYTHTGGIWQPVWVEGRAAAHITRVHVTPDLAAGTARFEIGVTGVEGLGSVRVESKDGVFPTVEGAVSGDTVKLDVRLPEVVAWSPENPHLYECVVTLGADRVETYFGMRSVGRGRWEEKGYEYVLLNGEPVYLRGALDQAFHPDGLYAYPSDEAIRADVQAAKDLGLNMLRCHIKINDPRYYYWCDKLGVLMMYDLPSCDVYTPTARANWEATFRAAVERDYSHPCIFSWILFNETWGLEEHQTPASWQWVKEMFQLAKSLDPTRLVEDNSTNKYDHVLTDLNSWHFYIDNYRRARHHVARVVAQTAEGGDFNYVSRVYGHVEGAREHAQSTAPLLNSEYAALGARGGDVDISYSFKFLTTDLRRHDKICGYVYTELTDVEWEHNGFLEYDRGAKEFGYEHFVPGMTVADLNGADVVGMDAPPCQTLPPGGTFSAPIFVSHWGTAEMAQPVVRWAVTFVDRLGDRREVARGEQRVERLARYSVTETGMLRVTLPEEPGLATVQLWLCDGDATRARNYVNVDVHAVAEDSPTLEPRVVSERLPGGGSAVSFAPEGFSDCSWPNPIIGQGDAKLGGPGAGWVEYELRLPEEVEVTAMTRMRVRFEAGARTARSRIGWPDPAYVKPTDYPQTEARKRPSRVVVSVNGVEVGRSELPDDPADARGVLSFQAQGQWEMGSYGYLITLEAPAEALSAIRTEVGTERLLRVRFEVPRGRGAGGLNLYGARAGAYPLNPTVLIDE